MYWICTSIQKLHIKGGYKFPTLFHLYIPGQQEECSATKFINFVPIIHP